MSSGCVDREDPMFISKQFKLHGLHLKLDAKTYVRQLLKDVPDEQYMQYLSRVIEAVSNQNLADPMVDLSIVKTAIRECTHNPDDATKSEFTVIDAFRVPKFIYVEEHKKFIPATRLGHPVPDLFGSPTSKAELYRHRHAMILQRLLRDNRFLRKGAHCWGDASQKIELSSVDSLFALSGQDTRCVTLGMITQLKEDRFYLEDPSGYIEMDLTRVRYKVPGLYTENAMVLVEGKCKDKILHVTGMCHPPPEDAQKTYANFGNVNFFGGPSETSLKFSERLLRVEESNPDSMFVILSDVWLDDPEILARLEQLFKGYEEFPPTCFILCGNFTRTASGKSQYQGLQKGFKALADMILSHASLAERSHFVLVPGLQDPALATILPRPPLPNTLVQHFKAKVPKAHFTTNPCRIQYCTQEIVVFRDDMVHKMCRNAIHMPSSMKDIPNHFAYSLFAQGHLSPLPLHVSPAHWSFDHCLSLYPLPDLVIMADKYDPFTETEHNCTMINPGCFPRNSFAFKVYLPASRSVEDSMLPAE